MRPPPANHESPMVNSSSFTGHARWPSAPGEGRRARGIPRCCRCRRVPGSTSRRRSVPHARSRSWRSRPASTASRDRQLVDGPCGMAQHADAPFDQGQALGEQVPRPPDTTRSSRRTARAPWRTRLASACVPRAAPTRSARRGGQRQRVPAAGVLVRRFQPVPAAIRPLRQRFSSDPPIRVRPSGADASRPSVRCRSSASTGPRNGTSTRPARELLGNDGDFDSGRLVGAQRRASPCRVNGLLQPGRSASRRRDRRPIRARGRRPAWPRPRAVVVVRTVRRTSTVAPSALGAIPFRKADGGFRTRTPPGWVACRTPVGRRPARSVRRPRPRPLRA